MGKEEKRTGFVVCKLFSAFYDVWVLRSITVGVVLFVIFYLVGLLFPAEDAVVYGLLSTGTLLFVVGAFARMIYLLCIPYGRLAGRSIDKGQVRRWNRWNGIVYLFFWTVLFGGILFRLWRR